MGAGSCILLPPCNLTTRPRFGQLAAPAWDAKFVPCEETGRFRLYSGGSWGLQEWVLPVLMLEADCLSMIPSFQAPLVFFWGLGPTIHLRLSISLSCWRQPQIPWEVEYLASKRKLIDEAERQVFPVDNGYNVSVLKKCFWNLCHHHRMMRTLEALASSPEGHKGREWQTMSSWLGLNLGTFYSRANACLFQLQFLGATSQKHCLVL